MSSKLEVVQPAEETAAEQPHRLCSEIQLFDLCELERCTFKEDRFCTDPELLARFEAVAEPEDRPALHFNSDEDDEDEDEFYLDDLEDDDDSDVEDEEQPEEDDAW
jgi:hypothetical protein